MNSHIDVIGKDMIAVNFNYVALGYIKDFQFIGSNTEGITGKHFSVSDQGMYVINKCFADNTVKNVSRNLKAIMNLKSRDLSTDHGFCEWIRSVCTLEKRSDKVILDITKNNPKFNMFWDLYNNLSTTEKYRRKIKNQQKHLVKR